MSRFIVIGQTGSAELLLVDTVAKTVQAVAAASIDQSVTDMRAAGVTAIRGVDVAVATDSKEQAVGRFLFSGGTK